MGARAEGKALKEEDKLQAKEKEELDKAEEKLKQQASLLDTEAKAIDKSIADGKMGRARKQLRKEHDLAASVKKHMGQFHKVEGKEEKKEESLSNMDKHASKQ